MFEIISDDAEDVVTTEETLAKAKAWVEERDPYDFFIYHPESQTTYYYWDGRWEFENELGHVPPGVGLSPGERPTPYYT